MKRILFWLIWIFLFAVYTATIVALCREEQYSALVFAALNLTCIAFLFFAKGFEVTLCILWSGLESAEPNVRNVLRNLDSEFIQVLRQVIVVLRITIVGLTTGSFEWISIPGLGNVQSYGAPYFFSLVFVSSTVLWFSQMFPKRLAAHDPVRFWKFSRWLVKPISVVGKILELPTPSNHLVAWWESLVDYPQCFPINSRSRWARCDCAVCKPHIIADSAKSNDFGVVPCGCIICRPAEISLP